MQTTRERWTAIGLVLAAVCLALLVSKGLKHPSWWRESPEPPAWSFVEPAPRKSNSDAALAARTAEPHVLPQAVVRSTIDLVEILVQTFDATGAGVAGLDIRGHDGEVGRVLGITGDDGTCVIAVYPERPLRLVARGPEHSSDVVGIDPSVEREVRIVLRDATTITGRVEWAWGGALGAGVIVQALEVGHDPLDLTPGMHFRELDRVHEAFTDDAGRFELRGVVRDTMYRLIAMSSECVSVDHGRNTRAGDDVVLEVGRLFGVRLAFRLADGSEPRASSWGRSLGSTRLDGLVGIPPRARARLNLPTETDGVLESVRIATSERDVPEAGPFGMGVTFAGHVPVEFDVTMPRLIDGEVATQRVIVEPAVDGFGRLQLAFTGGGRDHGIEAGGVTQARLLMCGPNETGHQWVVPLDHWPHHGQVINIDHVPNGRYGVSLTSPMGRTWYPLDTELMNIEVRGNTSIMIDLAHVGSAVFELFDRDGNAYRDSVVVKLRTGSVFFRSAPYVVDGLTPGTYSFFVNARSEYRFQSSYYRATIEPGRLTTATFDKLVSFDR